MRVISVPPVFRTRSLKFSQTVSRFVNSAVSDLTNAGLLFVLFLFLRCCLFQPPAPQFAQNAGKVVVARGISQQDGSVAGMSAAVLTKIGRRALRAGNCRRTVVIRERAGQEPWPVIVVVADFVGQRIMTNTANEGVPRRLFVTPKGGVLVYAGRTASSQPPSSNPDPTDLRTSAMVPCAWLGSVRLSQKSYKAAVLLGFTLLSVLSLPDRREGGSGGSRYRRPLELSSGGSKFPRGQALWTHAKFAPVNVAHEP
jgi:hypothetical protein